ncbi:MAG: nucleotidyltransferase domain-containing protein [Euryarchaeota archaeon]|nr:nucleotidyltransferase domain-containing protein [Euryarchaeota archaeon]
MLVSHTDVADEFVRRVRERNVGDVERLVLFGSTARGETEGIDSDVDFLAVVSDSADQRAPLPMNSATSPMISCWSSDRSSRST